MSNARLTAVSRALLTARASMEMPGHYPAGVPSHWNTYFAVSDADAATARCVALGGTRISPPFDTPFGRISFVVDPSGARFNLMQEPPAKE